MAWTTPSSQTTGTLITASIWNTDIVDNLIALKDPPSDYYTLNEGANYTTTSTSFVDVDAVNLALTITTTGGDVFVGFHGVVANGSAEVFFDVDQDGARIGGDDGIIRVDHGGDPSDCCFVRQIENPSAASHTYKLQWKVLSGTGTLYAGAGTSNLDVHPQFWVRELT